MFERRQTKLTQEEKDILSEIRHYFKSDMNITDIHIEDDEIHILTTRPGLIIGPKGRDYYNLKHIFIQEFNKDIKLHIHEDYRNKQIQNYLTLFELEGNMSHIEFSRNNKEFNELFRTLIRMKRMYEDEVEKGRIIDFKIEVDVDKFEITCFRHPKQIVDKIDMNFEICKYG